MTPVGFLCDACGEVLGDFETGSEPVVRLATGLTFHTDGSVICPKCGHETKINFGGLESLVAATVTH